MNQLEWIIILVLKFSCILGFNDRARSFACNKTFDVRQLGSKNGSIASSKYPESYPPGIICQYEFIAEGQQRIQLEVAEMDLFYGPGDPYDPYECSDQDSLTVLVYLEGKEEKLHEFCGKKKPPLLMSSSQRMKVIFKSENKQEKEIGSKFVIKYSFRTDFGVQGNGVQDHRKICTFMFRSTLHTEGFFTSPNFGGEYPRLTKCEYLFFGRENEQVVVEFQQFDVDGIIPRCDANTDSDRVEFSNFLNAQDRKLKPYCGSQLRYMPQKSDSAFFRVTFYSNHKFDANGFLAKYHFIAIDDDKTTPAITGKPDTMKTGPVGKGSNFACSSVVYILTIIVICRSVISLHLETV